MNIPRHNGPSRGGSSIDPITFEVIRHKLEAITEEQAITLKNVSGSPVVTEATDFNVGIYLADGAIVNMGPQVIFHAGTMSTVIYSIIENFSANPGINEGDMFILNDPYRGAIHQPDVSIVMPIFHEGRRIAWTGSCAHELDTGGMTFGSWAFGATDVQQEAMLLPGVKIVEKGVLREDIWQMIMGMTRLPHVVGLDFKAMIAANNVAARRFHQLMERYGVDTVDQVMRTEIDTSEKLLRERLKLIPDGIYRARDFLDHDGHANRLYQIEVAAIKQGDRYERILAAGPRLHQLHAFWPARRAIHRHLFWLATSAGTKACSSRSPSRCRRPIFVMRAGRHRCLAPPSRPRGWHRTWRSPRSRAWWRPCPSSSAKARP